MTNTPLRYLTIAMLVLAIPLALEMAGFGRPSVAALDYVFISLYVGFHVLVGSVAFMLSAVMGPRVRAAAFLIVATIGFVASTLRYGLVVEGSIHFYVFCWISVLAIALDYFLRRGLKRTE
jgi:hypothetical protein